jgi:serine protease Do
MRILKLFGFLALILCTSCGPMPNVKQVAAKNAMEIKAGEKARTLQFKKIVIKLKRGEEIGRIHVGVFCIDRGPFTWKGGQLTLTGDEFTEVFKEELEKAHYQVVGDPDALFDDISEWKAEFLVAGMIKEMKTNLCFPNIGFGDSDTARGSAYIKVDWQVYSRLSREVVFHASTEGSSLQEQDSSSGWVHIFLNAFAAATQNLLSDEGFHNLVVRSDSQEKKNSFDKIKIAKVEQFQTPLTEHISQNRAGVVTVFAGNGHGSGFFIDENGYLLTDAHVVGEAKMVTVRLVTGREIVGEVIRSDKKRDVAIVKVEEEKMIPLPVSSVSVNIGGKVYAIGTPLDVNLSTTLSSGIISGFRIEDGQRYIQSDTNILPGNSGGPLLDENGNVLGIAVYIIGLPDAPSGLNFFIPINEALEAINIEIGK